MNTTHQRLVNSTLIPISLKAMKKQDKKPKVIKNDSYAKQKNRRSYWLKKFEKEYRDAVTNPKHKSTEFFGDLSADIAEQVLDKYMEMKTDLFDSDDLNNIIDKIESEK